MTLTLSPQEEFVIRTMRELKPFESITINKDKDGKPNTFLVVRTQKTLATEVSIFPVR